MVLGVLFGLVSSVACSVGFIFNGSWAVFRLAILIVNVICSYLLRPLNGALLDVLVYIDVRSFIIIIISFLVGLLSLVCSCKDICHKVCVKRRVSERIEWVIIGVVCICVMFFLSSQWLLFFVFFELSLVPTLWLILKWGYQPERLQAGLFIIIYTVCASLPLIVCLVLCFLWCGRDMFLLVKLCGRCYEVIQGLPLSIWFCLVFSFLVKFPVFLFHR